MSELLDQALEWIHWSGAGGVVSLRGWIYNHFFAAAIASPFNASLAFAIAYVLVLYLLAWGLYRRGWFLRV